MKSNFGFMGLEEREQRHGDGGSGGGKGGGLNPHFLTRG